MGTQGYKVTRIDGMGELRNLKVPLASSPHPSGVRRNHHSQPLALAKPNNHPCTVAVQSLVLRSNLIHKIQNLEGQTRLELLELYDNKIREIKNIFHLTQLR